MCVCVHLERLSIDFVYLDCPVLYRYMPNHEMQTFPVAGVHLVPSGTDCGDDHCSVTLSRLTREHSGGAYKCEISTEGPTFYLLSKTTNITVAGRWCNNRFWFSWTLVTIECLVCRVSWSRNGFLLQPLLSLLHLSITSTSIARALNMTVNCCRKGVSKGIAVKHDLKNLITASL